jgi:outer membrane protein assembly factor BamD (BamD/ComL family)
MKKIRLILAFLFLLTPAFAQDVSPDHQEIFEEKFSQLLRLSMDQEATEEGIGLAADKLLQFAKDYPESKFAKDAQYLYNLILFTGTTMAGDKEKAYKFMREMERVVNLYPGGSLEELSLKKWVEILGDDSSKILYIPFESIITYMRGLSGFQFKDYASAIENFSLLKDSLDFKRDNTGILAEEVYLPLALSYQLTNNMAKFEEVAKEAVERFPDTHLGQSMQKVLDNTKAQ